MVRAPYALSQHRFDLLTTGSVLPLVVLPFRHSSVVLSECDDIFIVPFSLSRRNERRIGAVLIYMVVRQAIAAKSKETVKK